jgi:AAA15 family ATPase/GTPase
MKLKDVKDLCILSGANDAGKSNILKALNLFFNNESDWHSEFDFYNEFSKKRLEEVRKDTIKGKQFISIKIEFNRPKQYRKSLPEVFSVTRKWTRDWDIPEENNNLETLDKRGRLPKKLSTAQRSLSKFLNKIHFEYIPAVKDRSFFEHSLGRLQEILLKKAGKQNIKLNETIDELAGNITKIVKDLQNDFKRATKIPSSIKPPQDLVSLFQSFSVSTDLHDLANVPLTVRGDGIQARFVPSLLDFMACNSNKFYIWGFEEPENSIEYNQVISLADDFASKYSRESQIFITTHSPAFTSLRKDNLTCFRIWQEEPSKTLAAKIWPAEKHSPDIEDKLVEELGFLRIQEELHEEYIQKRGIDTQLREKVEQLQKKIRKVKMPVVLVEGKTDAHILTIAWRKLYAGKKPPFKIKPSEPIEGMGGGADTLRKFLESTPNIFSRPIVGIFDRDQKGISNYNKLRNFKKYLDFDSVKARDGGSIFAVLLPVPKGREEYANFENLPIEFLFPDEVLEIKKNGIGLTLEYPKARVVVKDRIIEEKQTNNPALRIIRDGKKYFAEKIVPDLEPDHFKGFTELFDILLGIVNYRGDGR